MKEKKLRRSLDRDVVTRILLVMAIAGAAELLLFGASIFWRFSRLEYASTLADLGRVGAALEAERAQLAEFTRDYASWDEARDFVDGLNPDFAAENFNAEWVEVASLDRVLVYSPQAEVLWSGHRGAEGYVVAEASSSLPEELRLGAISASLRAFPKDKPWIAFTESSGTLLLNCAYPVTDSAYAAPPHGWILFARRFDEAMLARISERAGLEARLSAEEPGRRLRALSQEGLEAAYFDEGGDRHLRLPILDSEGRRLLTLETSKRRQLDAPARELLAEIFLLLVLASAGTSLALLGVLRRLAVLPLIDIAQRLELRSGGEEAVPSLGLGKAAGRYDEIGLVSDRIDALFQGLAAKQTELRRAHDELERLATIDYVTGLANRRFFAEAASRELKRLARNRRDNKHAGTIALALADIDHFKLFNDRYGHQTGDLCLRQVAEAIARGVKRPADLPCRFGGEEFILLLPDTDAEGALVVAENIRKAVEALAIPHDASPVGSWVTISLGVAASRVDGDFDFEALVEQADKALYRAKEGGRNRVAVAD